jgi:cell division protein FtsB
MDRLMNTLLVKPLPPRRGTSVWLRRALIFATVVVLVNALVGQGGFAESVRAQHEYAAALARLSALQHDNAELATRAHGLAHDAKTIETVARQDLGVIRPGEVMFVLKPVK